MFKNASLAANRKRVFNSVFAPISLKEHAPPTSTGEPAVPNRQPRSVGVQKERASSRREQPGQQTGGDRENRTNLESDKQSSESASRDRAWHFATDFLRFADCSINELFALDHDSAELSSQQRRVASRETSQALAYLLSRSFRSTSQSQKWKEYDLIDWYGNEIRRHFLANFRASLVTVRSPLCVN